jgi:hypothetical protein
VNQPRGSTFATPAIGRAYLAGRQSAVAVWRSGTLPKWAGVLYAPTGLLISILGLMVGASQTLGPLLLIAGGGWIAWTVWLCPHGTETEPRVR